MASTADTGSRIARAALARATESNGQAMTVSGENTSPIARLSNAIAFQANIVALSVAMEAAQAGLARPAMGNSEACSPSPGGAQASKDTVSSHESITNSSGASQDQVS